jgi:hypothetical protein
LSATRWKFGVWIGPPNVLLAPKPTSSVRIKRTLGAPAGASTRFGKSGAESITVRPILPSKGGSGCGNTVDVRDAALRGSPAKATAEAAMTDVDPRRRHRLISTFPTDDGLLDFLSELSSLLRWECQHKMD